MKITNLNLSIHKGKLFKACLTILLILPGSMVQSQESNPGLSIYPAVGLGFGFFYPEDVNHYLEASLPPGYVTEYGFSDLIAYYDLHAGVTFRMKRFDVSGILEYNIAPKLIFISNGDDLSFLFHRIAPGITANYYIPMASGVHAFFLGGGVHYSFMMLEDFSASNPGFRIQAGVSLQFNKINLQPFSAFIYAAATDSSNPDWGNFNMNYTSGQIGLNISFHQRINYK